MALISRTPQSYELELYWIKGNAWLAKTLSFESAWSNTRDVHVDIGIVSGVIYNWLVLKMVNLCTYLSAENQQ